MVATMTLPTAIRTTTATLRFTAHTTAVRYIVKSEKKVANLVHMHQAQVMPTTTPDTPTFERFQRESGNILSEVKRLSRVK
jgi:hypothetical protein